MPAKLSTSPWRPSESGDQQQLREEANGAASPKGTKKEPGGARPWLCPLALAATQASFVVGSVYLKSSLQLVDSAKGEKFSPVIFAFAREAVAAPLLGLVAWFTTGKILVPAWRELFQFFLLGCCLFLSQLLYILGIQLSGVAVASCMQPAIPVFTALLGISFRLEAASPTKLAGIALAVVGALSMVLGSSLEHDVLDKSHTSALGNFCLLVNTLSMSVYYVLAKRIVAKHPPAAVSAWAYLAAALLMGSTAAMFTSSSDWHYPRALILPLLYWVLVCSVSGYLIVTWALSHLPSSTVAAFQCLQPFLGTVLAFLVLHEQLSWWDLGALGVLAGLFLVASDMREGGAARRGWLGRLVRSSSASQMLPGHLNRVVRVINRDK